jgi:hypothetical protein
VLLMDSIGQVLAQLEKNKKQLSDHAVAEILLDERARRKVLGKAGSDELSRLLQKVRNSESEKGPLLGKTALRNYLRKMRGARRAFLSGAATPFQRTCLEADSLYREIALEYEAECAAGQIEASKRLPNET